MWIGAFHVVLGSPHLLLPSCLLFSLVNFSLSPEISVIISARERHDCCALGAFRHPSLVLRPAFVMSPCHSFIVSFGSYSYWYEPPLNLFQVLFCFPSPWSGYYRPLLSLIIIISMNHVSCLFRVWYICPHRDIGHSVLSWPLLKICVCNLIIILVSFYLILTFHLHRHPFPCLLTFILLPSLVRSLVTVCFSQTVAPFFESKNDSKLYHGSLLLPGPPGIGINVFVQLLKHMQFLIGSLL